MEIAGVERPRKVILVKQSRDSIADLEAAHVRSNGSNDASSIGHWYCAILGWKGILALGMLLAGGSRKPPRGVAGMQA